MSGKPRTRSAMYQIIQQNRWAGTERQLEGCVKGEPRHPVLVNWGDYSGFLMAG